MSKLVRLNQKTLTIRRTWQEAPVSFGRYKKKLLSDSVGVNKRQLCDLLWSEAILCPFLRLGKGSMGISLSGLTRRWDNLLHHTDWVTLTCVHITFTFKKTQVSKNLFNFMCGNSSEDTEWQLQIKLFILLLCLKLCKIHFVCEAIV